MYKVALRLAALCLLIGLFLAAFPMDRVRAQDDADTVNSRLDRLEHDLNALQRQVYRSASGTAAPAGDSGGPAPSGNEALSLQLRMDQIESEMRDLTGQIEEVQYGVSQLKSRLDKMQSDDELRFQALEHPGAAPVVSTNGGASAAAPAAAPAAPTSLGADQGPPPSPSGLLSPPGSGGQSGQPPGAPIEPNQGPPPDDQTAAVPPPVATPAGSLPDGTPQQQYSYAFGLLRQAKYPDAQRAFTAFLKKHPRDSLAGNAQYWLGETYFAQNQFQQAAAIFAQGYGRYPQSPKASDNLLKLGISLGNIGRKHEACIVFGKLDSEYSKVLPSVKERERQEKQKFGCS